MEIIDYAIVIVYLLAVVAVGLYIQRRTKEDISSFFLGSNGIPWWALSASGMSSNLDVSGTMINVAMVFVLGVSGFWVELRGGVTANLAFMLAFQAKWNRRSKMMTLAEWMEFRFGPGRAGDAARITQAISMLLLTVFMTAYFAVGGKFIGEFLHIPAFWASTLMVSLAMVYTVTSGLQGVVWTDVFQGLLIFAAIVFVCAHAMLTVDVPALFTVSVPLNDGGFYEVDVERSAWESIVPPMTRDFPADSQYSMFNIFGVAVMGYFVKAMIDGVGGPNSYMAQRFFAAKSDREASMLTFLWILLLSFRWPFIVSVAILGIQYGIDTGATIDDPERVLPIVIDQVPTGVKGLMVAALTAAGMSTFDSTINAGAAYWVKDIYHTYIRKDATQKQLMWQSRVSSCLIVLAGLLLTLLFENINEIWSWINMSFSAGILLPFMARWYWERLNGWGFMYGTLAGILGAVVQRLVAPDVPEYFSFVAVACTSLVGMAAGTYFTEPTPESVLKHFYVQTRPFGFWSNTRRAVNNPGLVDAIARENRFDVLSILVALPWQLTLFLAWMMVIIGSWTQFALMFSAWCVLSVLLYFFWYKKLSADESDADVVPFEAHMRKMREREEAAGIGGGGGTELVAQASHFAIGDVSDEEEDEGGGDGEIGVAAGGGGAKAATRAAIASVPEDKQALLAAADTGHDDEDA